MGSCLSLSRPHEMRSSPASDGAFEMLVVGSGGGPDQTDLSSYLVKPRAASWQDGILSLEGGSGVGVLRRLLEQNPTLLTHEEVFGLGNGPASPRAKRAGAIALQTYSFVRDYAITHAHFDHINGLVIMAGSSSGHRTRVHGLQGVLDRLLKAFDGGLWPTLASFDKEDDNSKYLCSVASTSKYSPMTSELSVRALPISHGCTADPTEVYDSTAFFVRNDLAGKEFLFFGDVEPDALSSNPRTLAVWQAAAPLIPDRLSAIFLECSWSSSRPDDLLFGHLSPKHFVRELCVLAEEVVKLRSKRRPSVDGSASPPAKRQRVQERDIDLRGALAGIRVHVIHCKETFDDDRPASEVIVEQIRNLVSDLSLGAEIIGVRQGRRIVF
ncbi:cAMP phosphodiesterases class-II-domain-containing protein [Auriculariales sp. MPI-PUGE-AT-0066]|nr:cAMP phosphodiesterases class-II-domain-containing protein [Auriculariales sp. MPI-PUGE-AT-0066]